MYVYLPKLYGYLHKSNRIHFYAKSVRWILRRSAEVHRAAMHPVDEQIWGFCEALPYLFADGIIRLAVDMPAIFSAQSLSVYGLSAQSSSVQSI